MSAILKSAAITLAAMATLAACAAHQSRAVCRTDCRANIDLPGNAAKAPTISARRMNVAGSGSFEFMLTGEGPPERSATTLRFHRPGESPDAGTPFLNRAGKPLYEISLRPGRNRLALRSYKDGVCHPPNGCKYDIINTGNPDRPARDPWIIIHR